MEEPVFGWVVEVGPDLLEGFSANEADFFIEACEFGGFELSAEAFGGEGAAPEDFVGHPVADTRKTFLVKEGGFDGETSVAREEIGHGGEGEGAGADGWGDAGPPGRGVFGLGDVDAAELAGVVKDEGAIFLVEDEVVVFRREVRSGGGAEVAGHAKVQAEPEIVGETKEHLFAGGFGGDEFLAGEFAEEGEIVTAKDALFAVKMNAEDFGVEAGIPLAAVVIDFGEFGHGLRLMAEGQIPNSK